MWRRFKFRGSVALFRNFPETLQTKFWPTSFTAWALHSAYLLMIHLGLHDLNSLQVCRDFCFSMLLLLLLEVGQADAGWDLAITLIVNRAAFRRVIIHFRHLIGDIEMVLNCTLAWLMRLPPPLHHEITRFVSIGFSCINLLGFIVIGQRRVLMVLVLELIIDAAVWGIFLKDWITSILDNVHRAQHLPVTALIAIQGAGLELIQTDIFVRIQSHWNVLPSRMAFSHHLAVELLLVFHHPHVWIFCVECLHSHIVGMIAWFLIAHTAYATNIIALAYRVAIYHKLRILVIWLLRDRHVRLESSAKLVCFGLCGMHRKRVDRITVLPEVDLAYRRMLVHAWPCVLLMSCRLLFVSTSKSIYGIVLWRAGCLLWLFTHWDSHLWVLMYHGQVWILFIT